LGGFGYLHAGLVFCGHNLIYIFNLSPGTTNPRTTQSGGKESAPWLYQIQKDRFPGKPLPYGVRIGIKVK
jgi:hypothetical protein